MNFKLFYQRLFLGFIFVSILGAFFGCAQILFAPRINNFSLLAYAALVKKNAPILASFFPPRDKVRPIIKGLIEAEQKAIFLSIYNLTDMQIAMSLIAAHERKVRVEIIADYNMSMEKYSKISLLAKVGIPVYRFPPRAIAEKFKHFSPLMHNKCGIFHQSVENKMLLMTGSLNLTKSAFEKNQENVLILDNQEMIRNYLENFEQLKLCSERFEVTVD